MLPEYIDPDGLGPQKQQTLFWVRCLLGQRKSVGKGWALADVAYGADGA